MTKMHLKSSSLIMSLPVINGKVQAERHLSPTGGLSRRFPSETVQDEGSWVEWAYNVFGESAAGRALEAEFDGSPEAWEKASEWNRQYLIRHIIDWNWCDHEGNPLPLPKDDPRVIDDLTMEEIYFLANLLDEPEEPPAV